MRINTLSPALILFAVALTTVSSCRSHRTATGKAPAPAAEVTANSGASDAGHHSPLEAVEATVRSYNGWHDVSMNVKCGITAPKSLSVSGKAIMIRGKEIRISFRMLGFEVGGFYADCDSLYFFEKINHTMVTESMARITAASGLTVSDIQDALLGQLMYPGGIADPGDLKKKYSVRSDSATITLKPRKSSAPWLYTLTDNMPAAIVSLAIAMKKQGEINCTYSPPLITDAGPAAREVSVEAVYGRNYAAASFRWNLETAAWNQGIEPNKKIPSDYRRIPFQTLMKFITQAV